MANKLSSGQRYANKNYQIDNTGKTPYGFGAGVSGQDYDNEHLFRFKWTERLFDRFPILYTFIN